MRYTEQLAIALVVITSCGPLPDGTSTDDGVTAPMTGATSTSGEGNTSTGVEPEPATSTTSSPATSSGTGEVETAGDGPSSGTDTSSGEPAATDTATGDTTTTGGPEPETCTHLSGDLDAVVCEQCEGALCCWALPVGVCLEACEQAGPLACAKGFSCRKIVGEDASLCWPDF